MHTEVSHVRHRAYSDICTSDMFHLFGRDDMTYISNPPGERGQVENLSMRWYLSAAQSCLFAAFHLGS
jgi:hypothetical protein